MTVEYVRDTYYNIKVFHVVVFALKTILCVECDLFRLPFCDVKPWQ